METPLRAFADAIAHAPARAAHGDRTDASHDLTLGQMPVADQPLAAILGQLVGMAGEQGGNLGLDRLRQQRSRAVAQHLGQRIGKSSWLGQLESVSLSHGGEVEASNTPTIRRFTSLTPSPTFAHSSRPDFVKE